MEVRITDAVVNNPEQRLKAPVNFTFNKGEAVAVVGRNGAGKSLVANIIMDTFPLIQGKAEYMFEQTPEWVYQKIKLLAFKDAYGADDSSYYYQQRWNSTEQEGYPTVEEFLGSGILEKSGLFDMKAHAGYRLVHLSSGELRKVQIIKALSSEPELLIIDNPFIGLDAESREEFSAALKEISKKVGIILLLSDLLALPDFITHVYAVKECADFRKYTVKEYLRDSPFKAETGRRELPEQKRAAILNLPAAKESGSKYVVRLKDVTIAYGGKTILDKVSWDIKRGEHWALSGHNGSGKSTLLNLITADNPQSYACDIELFGRKRGSGESIWDIKREIGYVSPELHRAFQKNVSVRDIVASGLLDTVGLYVKPPKEKMPLCDFWMDMFGIGGIAEKMFLRISSGEQRLALLARAFVKDPQLLILDEPLHGLDTCNRMLTREIIETFCRRPGKTLIMVTHYPQELPSCIDKIKKL